MTAKCFVIFFVQRGLMEINPCVKILTSVRYLFLQKLKDIYYNIKNTLTDYMKYDNLKYRIYMYIQHFYNNLSGNLITIFNNIIQ